MKYKTHRSAGVLSCVLFMTAIENINPLLILGAWFSSLLPDIDHKESYMGSRALVLSKPIHDVFGHRDITHSLVAMIIFTTPLLYVDFHFGLACGIGYLSHLLMDLLTNTGVPLFYTQNDKRYKLLNLKTGGEWEVYIERMFNGTAMVLPLLIPYGFILIPIIYLLLR